MYKHIENNTTSIVFELEADNSNIKDFYSADVVGNRRFAQNYGGYPRSEIAEINDQVSLVTAQNLLRDLNVFEPSNPNAGLSDAEIMLGHRSKYQQTASESVSWLEGQIAIRDANRNPTQPSQESETIQFDSNDNPSES